MHITCDDQLELVQCEQFERNLVDDTAQSEVRIRLQRSDKIAALDSSSDRRHSRVQSRHDLCARLLILLAICWSVLGGSVHTDADVLGKQV